MAAGSDINVVRHKQSRKQLLWVPLESIKTERTMLHPDLQRLE